MELRDIDCEVERWINLHQDHVQWQALILAVLKLRRII
jgi:hypothetical protein